MITKLIGCTLLLTLTVGCSASKTPTNTADIGMHKAGVNYLARDVDKAELKILKSKTSVDFFGDTPKTSSNLSKSVNEKTTTFMLANVPQRFPLAETTWTQYFQGIHAGVDLSYTKDSGLHPKVYAAGSGSVTKAGDGACGSGYGKCVLITHGDQFQSLYGHLDTVTVNEKDTVSVGDPIGTMGNSGVTNGSTGIHLHFEVRAKGMGIIPSLSPFISTKYPGGYLPQDPANSKFLKELVDKKEGDTIKASWNTN